jgi:hypothetical protein
VTTIHLGPLITTDLTLPVTDLNLDVAEEHRVKSDTMAIKFSLNPKRHLSGKMTNTVFMTYDLGSSGLDFYEFMEDKPDCLLVHQFAPKITMKISVGESLFRVLPFGTY